MKRMKYDALRWMYRWCCGLCFLLLMQAVVQAQQPLSKFSISNGKMIIELNKDISSASLDSFIRKYNLGDLALGAFIKQHVSDSLHKLGWSVEISNDKHFIISKPFGTYDATGHPADRIAFSEKSPALNPGIAPVSMVAGYGVNRLRNKVFIVADSLVTFYLRNNDKAKTVFLTGNFNNWSINTLPMTPTDSGWRAVVKLAPGKYWYKFIVDGEWLTDKDNQNREPDGEGNINSVYFQPNTLFHLRGYEGAKRVYVAGSFNNWAERNLPLVKTEKGWMLPVYLPPGTHTYRFIADGRWMEDPANPERLPNEFGEFNSVMRIGKSHLFQLEGYGHAKQVILSASFNGWREDELYMKKTATGWELPYALGPGNHEYKFIVDGKWIHDPSNPLIVTHDKDKKNSFLIIEPNYTFRLKGFPQARQVYLAGDFNNWNQTTLAMQKQGDEWVIPVHLSHGKHRYKFLIDGEWKLDPGNKLWEQNEFGTGNSIIWIEK